MRWVQEILELLVTKTSKRRNHTPNFYGMSKVFVGANVPLVTRVWKIQALTPNSTHTDMSLNQHAGMEIDFRSRSSLETRLVNENERLQGKHKK